MVLGRGVGALGAVGIVLDKRYTAIPKTHCIQRLCLKQVWFERHIENLQVQYHPDVSFSLQDICIFWVLGHKCASVILTFIFCHRNYPTNFGFKENYM